ncbi:MAG: hypothetical protein DWQ31_09175 [Planctomycetota bacterium]|nr:MAG: hypothetical protein DWQ31_09175 [Planctomycetota bacterium]REJ91377.1 MAG: hypothetical protein DWQ35_14590 [Planctomycetota bacterium]REK18503.1 MAG: hypothetical protein DWQ42_20095 [Planctomycetota bacterium]REK39437.1 MAG: hypothetical protein DWQ46_19410 [Planctomycetota bacterium]
MSEIRIARTKWILCAWPGLAQLWLNGAVAGLALALGFTLLLNLALVASFGWVGLMSSSGKVLTWAVVLLFWISAGAVSLSRLRAEAARRIEREEVANRSPAEHAAADPFVAATNEYLQGNWYEVERLLDQLLRRDAQDVEARLMWATMCRHTGRLDEARRRLDDLSRRERAAKWQVEIARERGILQRTLANGQEENKENEQENKEHVEEPGTKFDSSRTNTAA